MLFIDEAGALLAKNDSYAQEAINSLVRLMEINPEVMVIFASYPEEIEQLLHSNAGLSRRVSIRIFFSSYDDDQMVEILQYLVNKDEFALEEPARVVAKDFFAALRKRKGDDFGNGREARRLYHAAIEQLALRSADTALAGVFSKDDIVAAAARLLS